MPTTTGKRYLQSITPINILTSLTPIFAFSTHGALGDNYDKLLLAFVNDDATNPVDVTIETTEDPSGLVPDGEHVFVLTVPAGVQRSFEIGPDLMRTYWRASGIATTATVSLRWELKGTPRYVRKSWRSEEP